MKPNDHFNLIMKSTNPKLGAMPTSIGPRSTCPDACPFKDNGCYAGQGFMNIHWTAVDQRKTGAPWTQFLDQVGTIAAGKIWRYATTGDLPGSGNIIDITRLQQLVDVNKGKMGYTYTHYPLTIKSNLKAIRKANSEGFIINISTSNLKEADKVAKDHGLPIASLVPLNTPNVFKTRYGRHGIVCPAQTSDFSCEQCKLCARASRATCKPGTAGNPIICFRPHGSRMKILDKLSQAT